MKKIYLHVALLLAALSAAACVDPLTPLPDGVSLMPGEAGLDLSVICSEIDTKASTKDGENDYNENALKSIDWFIFPSAVANNEATPAVLHGRVSWTNGEHDNVSPNVEASAFLAKSVRMDEYINLAGCGRTGYVYVLANLPNNYTHLADELADGQNEGGIQYTVGDETVTVNTLQGLRALTLTTNFNSYTVSETGSVSFVKQPSFVMESLKEGTVLLPFEFAETATSAKVLAPLSRVAAKITLDIDLATAIDEIKAKMVGRDTLKIEYVQTWYPKSDSIQIYLSYANSKTTVKGTPVNYNPTDFFTYNRYSFNPAVTPAAPKDSIYYDKTIEGYYDYPLYHDVTGTPFYSYPLFWQTSDTHAPFIKIIIPWTAYEEDVTYEDHNYINHNFDGQFHIGDTLRSVARTRNPEKITSEGTQEFYYKILIPVEELKLQSNNWYKIALDVAVLGSRTDDLSTILSGRYFVVDWGNPQIASGSVLDEGRYLSVPDTLYTMNAVTSITIPVNSSHPITTDIVRLNNAGSVIANSGNQGLRWRNRTWETVTRGSASPNGRTSFTFTDNLNTTMGRSMDCYPMRFVVRVRHTDRIGKSDEAEYTKYVAIVQYPSIYVDSKIGGPSYVDGYYGNSTADRYGYYGYPNTTSTTFNQTVQNHNSPYTYSDNNGLRVTFETYDQLTSGGIRYYRMGGNNQPGTITIEAPENSLITAIDITYRGNDYDNRPVNYTHNGTQTSSSTTQWRGSASQVIASMSTSATVGDRNQVRSISVTYSRITAVTGASGTSEGSGQNDPSHITTPYGHLARFASYQTDMTVISISAFAQGSSTYTVRLNNTNTTRTYLIADPREPANYTSADLDPYFTGSTTVGWTDEEASKILMGITSMPNYIAPKFMISSRWGRQVWGNTSYNDIKKRCATYQEAGFPAGRWRLPTEAEVNFIFNLQQNDFIDDLFNNTARYWVADGHYITGGNTITVNTPGTDSGQSSRCVYDLWYWGENPVTPIDQYHIAP